MIYQMSPVKKGSSVSFNVNAAVLVGYTGAALCFQGTRDSRRPFRLGQKGVRVEMDRCKIELKCGKNETIPNTEKMYGRAKEVASKFGISTYFDRCWDHGDEFCDGYVYPPAQILEEVLQALDRADVEYDNIDLPSRLEGSELHRRLLTRFPCGVAVDFID